jgi:type I restriction enzyme S subunit
MAGEWPKTWSHARLGDVADVNWGDTSVTKASYLECGFPAYSATGPDGFLPYADYDRTGVILSAIGAECGRTWLARGKWSCIKNTIRFWSIRQDVDTEFLYWLTRDPSIWPKRGSAQPFISQGDARNLVVAYPPLTEQRAIAHILGTLDDKIELNRRMNETLEAMARAIFKSWFVDFDPVRAKAEGRKPFGMDAATAALFPASFDDSSLGKIPKGWVIRDFPDEVDFLEGPGLRHWQYRSEGVRFLNIRCIEQGDLQIEKANCISEDEFKDKYTHFALQKDDIVISTSGTLGRLAIVREDHLPVMLNTSIIRMQGRKPIGLTYAWATLQSEYFLDEMFALASGSVQLNFGPMHLRRIKILRPPDIILERFEQFAQPTLRLALQNRQQSRVLASIRDALLPKLISGEIRVKEQHQSTFTT